MKKIIRVTTVPQSLWGLLKGQLGFMSKHYEMVGVSDAGWDSKMLERGGAEENIRVKAISMTRKITPIKDIIAVWKLYTFFRKERPFIVHTHTPKAGILGMTAAKLAGVRHRLHTVAGLPLVEATGFKRKILNFVERKTYSYATKVYPNSFGLKDIILDNQFTNHEKLKVIGHGSSNGIDSVHYSNSQITEETKKSLKKELKIKSDDFVFVFVGRVVADKGINEMVRAFLELNEHLPHVQLLIVGPYESELDPLDPETNEVILSHERVIYVGVQQDVRPYIAISDAMVFPSYREGFPNVVMQACAMEIPSVVSDINGCNEIIQNGLNGFIVPVKNVEALYKGMLKMTTLDKATLKKMGAEARNTITSKYEQRFIWDELLKEYNSLT